MSENYDLAVIGGGSAGLTAAEIAAVLGWRVALIERDKLGGDCTWTGCVPSKALIAIAREIHAARLAASCGILPDANLRVDFARVMQQVRQTQQDIYANETPDQLRAKNIDVILAEARFSDPHTLTLSNGQSVRARYILLATGAWANVPPGFADAPHLTHKTLFELDEMPEHLIIVGGGPIGTEMAQAFRRLGARVTVLTDKPRLLMRDDEEAAQLIMQIFRDEGIAIRTGTQAVGASGQAGDVRVQLDDGTSVNGSHVLLAVGKRAHFEHLNVEAAGVALDERGRLRLNGALRTTQKHIYAAGDAASGPQFSHAASSQATLTVLNMALPIAQQDKPHQVPWATFTDPEVAHVGLTEAEAQRRHGPRAQVTRMPISGVDRAMTEGYRQGFIKLMHRRGGKLLGATIVGPNAGEMLNEWVSVYSKGGRVLNVALAQHVYPTLGTGNAVAATEQLRHWADAGPTGRLLRRLVRVF